MGKVCKVFSKVLCALFVANALANVCEHWQLEEGDCRGIPFRKDGRLFCIARLADNRVGHTGKKFFIQECSRIQNTNLPEFAPRSVADAEQHNEVIFEKCKKLLEGEVAKALEIKKILRE